MLKHFLIKNQSAKLMMSKDIQDATYRNIDEMLLQLKFNHDEDMAGVQTQHETSAIKYQNELCLNFEVTNNKLSKTRELCDVLENYNERVNATLAKCKTVIKADYDKLQKSDQVVRDVILKQVQHNDRNKLIIENLQEKVTLTREHPNQSVMAIQEKLCTDLCTTKKKLDTVHARKDVFQDAIKHLSLQLELCKHQIQQKDETIAEYEKKLLQNNIKNKEIANLEKGSIDEKNTLQKQQAAVLQNYSASVATAKELNIRFEGISPSSYGSKVRKMSQSTAPRHDIIDLDELTSKSHSSFKNSTHSNDNFAYIGDQKTHKNKSKDITKYKFFKSKGKK